jgi:hypothetical protein
MMTRRIGAGPLQRFSFRCSAGLQACPNGGPEGPHYTYVENALAKLEADGGSR